MGRKQFTKTVEVAEELESQKCKVTISGKEYLYEKGDVLSGDREGFSERV